jgi:hypothetical protein
MSNAARRVLELFLHPPKRGVTGVTSVTAVTGPFVTLGNPMVTPVTSVTCQKQHSPAEGVMGVTAACQTEAETLTSEASIIQWLNRNPAPSPAGRCAWCGQLESESAVVLPFGTEPGTHAWLHGECWPGWHQARRAEAVKALGGDGILADVAQTERP